MDEDKEEEFDYDTYSGGVECFGKLDTNDRREIFFERRNDRTLSSRSE
jgi:hypothetical protein